MNNRRTWFTVPPAFWFMLSLAVLARWAPSAWRVLGDDSDWGVARVISGSLILLVQCAFRACVTLIMTAAAWPFLPQITKRQALIISVAAVFLEMVAEGIAGAFGGSESVWAAPLAATVASYAFVVILSVQFVSKSTALGTHNDVA